MQVTIGAKCWDGMRKKSLFSAEVVKVLPLIERQRTRFDPRLKALLGFAVPMMFVAGGFPPFGITSAFAQTIGVVAPAAVPAMAMAPALTTKILHAFDPLIDLIQSLSYPIAGVMIAGGCLFIMVGNREKGMQMLQNAAIGYILVQLSPMILSLLVGVGKSV
jgi:hypothetical protein